MPLVPYGEDSVTGEPGFAKSGESIVDEAGTELGGGGGGAEALVTDGTTTNATGTGDQNLKSYAMPANTLNADNEYLEIITWGTNNGGSTADFTVAIGATTVLDTTIEASTNYFVHLFIYRTGSSAESVAGSRTSSSVAPINTTAAEDLTSALTIQFGKQSGVSVSFDQDGLIIKKHPAA